MANSEFEYVRAYEQVDVLLPSNWIVIRIDGRGFSKFTKRYDFKKPNDRRAIDLMNAAAVEVVRSLVDVVVAYGQSDEYSFVFHEATTLFERRASKLVSTVVSTFTAEYAHLWSTFFPDRPLTRPLPTFDGRHVLYPKVKILKDYLSWRQADCHVNNLYNTTFWALVQKGGRTGTEAELELKGTFAADKNEILFSQFGINYNDEPDMYKKGSVIYRDLSSTYTVTGDEAQAPKTAADTVSKTRAERVRKCRQKASITVEHVDIIKEAFWGKRPWLLECGTSTRR